MKFRIALAFSVLIALGCGVAQLRGPLMGGRTFLQTQVIVRDSFTRANSGNLGANWTANSGAIDTALMGITSNAARVQTTGGHADSFWNANTFATNQYAEGIAGGSAISVNTHEANITVVDSSGDNYDMFYWNQNATTDIAVGLAEVVGGSYTPLATASAGTFVLGGLMRLEKVGTVLTGYFNGVPVVTGTSTLNSGAPGVHGYMAASSPTAYVTNWEGGNLVWTRQGIVEPASRSSEEPGVIYEGGCVIVASPCFKMWYTVNWTSPPPAINYAESTDGKTFSEYSGNPVISNGATAVAHGYVVHIGSTYYGYYWNGASGAFDQWTSADGVTSWTLAHASVLAPGTTGAWDAVGVYDSTVFVNGATWYMLYQGSSAGGACHYYCEGLATSSDGITWTKYSGNPVIANGSGGVGGGHVYQAGANYYLWAQTSATVASLPTDISLYSSPDLMNWTPSSNSRNPVYERVLADEGVNLSSGQVADACMVTVGGTTYFYYDATDTQDAGHIHINLATAPYTLQQISLAYK